MLSRHVYEVTEWKSSSDKYYCNDIKGLGGVGGKWWIPARILNISPADFILLLKDKFNVDHLFYNIDKDVLIYSWDNQKDCHKYVLWINKEARKRNFLV